MKQINKRNIAVCIILSIVTLGIYSIYWTYLMIKNIRMLQNDNRSCTGEMLCYIFVPFYSWYWWYTRGERVKKSFDEHNCRSTGSGVLYLILCIFGLPIINMALMQNDFNSFEDDDSLPIKQNFDISDTNYITNGTVADSNDIQSSTPKSYSKKAPMPYEKLKKILLSAYAVFFVLVIAATGWSIVEIYNTPAVPGKAIIEVDSYSGYSKSNDSSFSDDEQEDTPSDGVTSTVQTSNGVTSTAQTGHDNQNKSANSVEYGTVQGTVTYKYNDFVGNRGDTGTIVMLFPNPLENDTAKYDNGHACFGTAGSYESGIMVAKCDGNGNYVFDNVPVGQYTYLIISQNTTEKRAFQDSDGYKQQATSYYAANLSDKDRETLKISVGLNKTKWGYVDVIANRNQTISHDFGISYS